MPDDGRAVVGCGMQGVTRVRGPIVRLSKSSLCAIALMTSSANARGMEGQYFPQRAVS